MRVFIAVNLDKDVKSHLKNMADRLSACILSARYTYPDNYHITLVFIGETDMTGLKRIIKAVNDTAAGAACFKVITSGAGSFKKNNKRVLYCEIENSAELNRIYSRLLNNLSMQGMDLKEGKFTPHITIAREAVVNDGFLAVGFDKKEIAVNSISVMESTRVNGELKYIARFIVNLGDGKNG